MRTHDYKLMKKFRCAVESCEATTANWFKDGWLIVGSAQSDFHDLTVFKGRTALNDRQILEDAGLIERSDLAVALICPEHAPSMRAFLEAAQKPTEPEKQQDVESEASRISDL